MAQLITSLNIGDKIAFGYYQVNTEQNEPIIWTIIHKTQYSVTLWSDKILDILAFDAKEPANDNNNIVNYGNNRYIHSNIRQWLNSDAYDGEWYSEQHGSDTYPNNSYIINGKGYNGKWGFLNLFTPEEKNIIVPTAVKTAKNHVIYSGNKVYDITYDKIFLLSATEIGKNTNLDVSEGELMDYFNPNINKSTISYTTTPTSSLVNNHNITGLTLTTSSYFSYGLRTPLINSSSKYYSVTEKGTLDSSNHAAYGNTVGLRPACNISPYTVVEYDDRDGLYKVELYVSRLRDLSIGDRIIFGRHKIGYSTQNQVIFPLHWSVADKFHEGYPDNSVTLVTKDVIDIRAFDGKEPNNVVGNRNSQGNNRYIHSNIRQWLNSDSIKGTWYNNQHMFDGPPSDDNISINTTDYENLDGFLYNFSERERRALINTKLIVSKNYASDGGGSDIFYDKIFLLSKTEVGLGSENNIAEGSVLKLFDDHPDKRISVADDTPGGILYHVGYFNLLDGHDNEPDSSSDNVISWLLRTPNSSSTYEVRRIDDTGEYSNTSANNGGYGIKVGCNLPGDAIVKYSDTIDGVAEYTIEVNTPASIYVNDIGNNIKSAPFSISYYIEDYMSDIVSVYLDDIILNGYSEITIQPNELNTINISQDVFDSITSGSHTIKIVAYNGLESTFEISFDKIDKVILAEVDTISGPLYKKTDSGYAMLFPTTTADNVYVDLKLNKTLKDKITENELKLYPLYGSGALTNILSNYYNPEIVDIIKIQSMTISSDRYIQVLIKNHNESDVNTGSLHIHLIRTNDLSISTNSVTINDVDLTKPTFIYRNHNYDTVCMYTKTSGKRFIYEFDLSLSIGLNLVEEMRNHVSLPDNIVCKEYYSKYNNNYYLLTIENEFSAYITLYDVMREVNREIRGFNFNEYLDEDFISHSKFIVDDHNGVVYIIYDDYINIYKQKYDDNNGLIYEYEKSISIFMLLSNTGIDTNIIHINYNTINVCLHETGELMYISLVYYDQDEIEHTVILSVHTGDMSLVNHIENIQDGFDCLDIIDIYGDEPIIYISNGIPKFFNTSLERININDIYCDKLLYANKNILLSSYNGELILYTFQNNNSIIKIRNKDIPSNTFIWNSELGMFECKILSSLFKDTHDGNGIPTVDININDINSYNIASNMGLYPIVEEYDGYIQIYSDNKIDDKTINMDLSIHK